MFKRILTPLDGSEASESILKWVAPLAEKMGAELVLTMIVGSKPVPTIAADLVRSGSTTSIPAEPPELMAERESRRTTEDDLTRTADRYLESVCVRHVPESVVTKFHVTSGNPEDEIIAAAISTDADLIAMATHRASWIARGVLGSVADRVVHSSPVSVLLLRPGENYAHVSGPLNIKNVIVPLDVSPLSEVAVNVGMDLSNALDAKIRFVTATAGMYVQGPVIGASWGHAYSGGQLRDEARSYLMPYVERARDMGVKAEGIAVSGNPAKAIIRVAHEEPQSIVVMTSHGLSGFHRWVLGSVTDKVIRTAECPVLVVAVKYAENE